MHVFTWRRALVLGAVAVLTGCVVALASSGGSVSTAREVKLTKLQRRTLSGFASFELGQTAGNEASALQRPIRFSPISNPRAADCPTHHGNNIKVNQNCLNISDRDLQGRGQAPERDFDVGGPADRPARSDRQRLSARRRDVWALVLKWRDALE